MRPIQFLPLTLTMLACAKPPQLTVTHRFDPPMTYFDSILIEQQTLAGVPYSKAYNDAVKADSGGLSTLLRATIHTDGIGSDTHDQILWDLLQVWGDSSFAVVLRSQSQRVREGVRCGLDYAAPASWASQNPRTAGLAPFNPGCRGD
jgi:hypothetical protein